jgi:hypothetical protein
MQTRFWIVLVVLGLTSLGSGLYGCTSDDCGADGTSKNCSNPTAGAAGVGAQGGTGAVGGNGGGGNVGGGGGEPCGGCSEPTPICDESSMMCVACLDHPDCTSPDAAKCDGGECVPCDDSGQCAGHASAEVCDGGTCVECALGEEGACTGGDTCDLVAKTCVSVAAQSVGNCEACTNDVQCETGHKCISMDFEMSFHGYYCLKSEPGCMRPFQTTIHQPSISGEAATDYCGIEEDLATCEATLALVQAWFCTVDGMCSLTQGGMEFPVPGALCRDVGPAPGQCTYACGTAFECPSTGPGSTCGGMPTPTWCGG